jgi:hypothetical protein
MTIVGPIWDMIVVSCTVVADAMCQESGPEACKHEFIEPFTASYKGLALYLISCDITGL